MSERIDDLQYKGLKLIQDTELFCFGTDAVLLASFTEVKNGEHIVDMGTGTGILSVLLAGRNRTVSITGIEIQPQVAALARRNMEFNGIADRVSVITGDIKNIRSLVQGRVHAVVCNPPYEKAGSGKESANLAHKIARHEIACSLGDVINSASQLLETGGRFYMIHRAKRTAEIIFLMKQKRIEPKVMRFVQAHENADPGYMLIKGVKDARPEIKVLAPLVMYDADGNETKEIQEIYHRNEAVGG